MELTIADLDRLGLTVHRERRIALWLGLAGGTLAIFSSGALLGYWSSRR